MPNIQNIAPALFKVGSLVSVEFNGPWTGEVTIKTGHQHLLGEAPVEKLHYEKGKLLLLPGKSMNPFDKIKKAAGSFLFAHSSKFPIRHARLVNNVSVENVEDYFKERRVEYLEMARSYAYGKYHEDKVDHKRQILARFPRLEEVIDEYWLPATLIESACDMTWLWYRVQDVEALNEVLAGGKKEFQGRMNGFIFEMAAEFRKCALDAALAFKKGMDRAKSKVDTRVVDKFKEFLDRFQTQDFLGDEKMKDMLNNIKGHVFAINSWDVKDDAVALGQIRTYLSEVEKMAAEEGEVSDLATGFIRSVGAGDMEIDATDEQVTGGVSQVDRGVSEEPVVPATVEGEIVTTMGAFEAMSELPPESIEVEVQATHMAKLPPPEEPNGEEVTEGGEPPQEFEEPEAEA